ncbi:MAG: glycosyltransferase family 4 protein, partial [Chloroflexota bacterium]
PGRGGGGEGDLPSPWEGEGPGVRVFLFAGRLEEEKGLRVLLSAAAQLPHISIAIAGDGPLRSLVEATKLPNVVYLGQLTAAELAQWRGRGRALVMPSIWYEVFGMSALEAMSEGLPVIASRIGALPELVEHEQTGLLIEPGNAQALAAAILRLWQDETLAHRLGAAGREKAQIHYSPERYMISLMALFESVKRET